MYKKWILVGPFQVCPLGRLTHCACKRLWKKCAWGRRRTLGWSPRYRCRDIQGGKNRSIHADTMEQHLSLNEKFWHQLEFECMTKEPNVLEDLFYIHFFTLLKMKSSSINLFSAVSFYCLFLIVALSWVIGLDLAFVSPISIPTLFCPMSFSISALLSSWSGLNESQGSSFEKKRLQMAFDAIGNALLSTLCGSISHSIRSEEEKGRKAEAKTGTNKRGTL